MHVLFRVMQKLELNLAVIRLTRNRLPGCYIVTSFGPHSWNYRFLIYFLFIYIRTQSLMCLFLPIFHLMGDFSQNPSASRSTSVKNEHRKSVQCTKFEATFWIMKLGYHHCLSTVTNSHFTFIHIHPFIHLHSLSCGLLLICGIQCTHYYIISSEDHCTWKNFLITSVIVYQAMKLWFCWYIKYFWLFINIFSCAVPTS